ncbi:MAG TPA: diacylglycerol kinase family protein [Thermomicrobiales bacterium]|nr:diacylglycerol kinase family protein [Thermomicrobiales bacterium]
MTRSVLAVINPATGRTPAPDIAERLRREAAARGIVIHIAHTERPGHAIEIARNHPEDIDTIIAVGGDGTVSDVVTGARQEPLTIAIIPVGSTNIIAKDLGIPRDLDAAMRVALGDGRPFAIDVATAGKTTFIHMAGAGFDAAMMRDASRSLKRRLGWVAYIPAALRHLRYPLFEATITVDGRTLILPARVVLFALGSSIVSPRFKVGEGIDRTDGIIDVCVFDPPSLLSSLTCVVWIALGKPCRSRWQHQLRGSVVSLDTDRPVPFEVDGDPLGVVPVDIKVSHRTVQILVPQETGAELRA